MTVTYEAIYSTTLGSTQSSVTLNSFSGYTDLVLVIAGRSTNGSGDDSMYMQFNGDSSSNYSWTRILGNGSSASSYRLANQTSGTIDGIAGGSTASGTFSTTIANFQNYANSTTNKTILGRSNVTGSYTVANVNLWRSTSAITSMVLSLATGSWATGSTFSLYGIKAE